MFQMFQIWLDRVLVKVFQWWSMMGLASYAHYQSASLRGLHTVNPLHPNTALLHWEEGTSREPLDARLSVNFPILPSGLFVEWDQCPLYETENRHGTNVAML
jgi:hypothetical protein